MPTFRRRRACTCVPRTAMLSCLLKDVQASSPSSQRTRPLLPSATILPRPPHNILAPGDRRLLDSQALHGGCHQTLAHKYGRSAFYVEVHYDNVLHQQVTCGTSFNLSKWVGLATRRPATEGLLGPRGVNSWKALIPSPSSIIDTPSPLKA